MKKISLTLLLCLLVVTQYAKNSHDGLVSSVSISPDSKLVASLSYNDLKVWELETGRLLYKYNYSGSLVKILPNNKTMLVVSDTARLIEIATGQVKRLYYHPTLPLKGVAAVSNDGNYLACNTIKGKIVLFKIETAEVISSDLQVSAGDYSYVRSIAFSSDSKTLLVTESYKKSLWTMSLDDFSTKQEIIGASAISVCRNQKFLFMGYTWSVGGGTNFTAKLINTGVTLNFEDNHSVYAIASHPSNSNLVATGTLGGVTIWDMDTREAKKLKGHKSVVNDVEFSPDGNYLVSCSGDFNKDLKDYTVRLWDAKKRKLIRVFEE